MSVCLVRELGQVYRHVLSQRTGVRTPDVYHGIGAARCHMLAIGRPADTQSSVSVACTRWNRVGVHKVPRGGVSTPVPSRCAVGNQYYQWLTRYTFHSATRRRQRSHWYVHGRRQRPREEAWWPWLKQTVELAWWNMP